MDTDDDLTNALRGIDPAADAHAPEALRGRVAALPRARRRGWLVTAAAAAAIAVAGAGFAFAPRGAERGVETVALETPAPGEIAPPIEASGGTGATAEETGAGLALMPAAGGDLAFQSGYRMDSAFGGGWGGWWGRQRFTVPPFDDSRSGATVYALDAASRFTPETLAGIAAALGVAGEPVADQHGGGWSVGASDGSGPRVSLSLWSGGQVWYSSGGTSPVWRCVEQATTGKDDADWAAVQEECRLSTPSPTEAQAREAMSTILRAYGVDEDDLLIEVDGDQWLDYENLLTVRAYRVADGMAAPVSIDVTVSHEGILWANGSIGPLVSLGEYDIVSPAEAAARLNTSAFSPDLTYAPPTGPESWNGEPATEPDPVPSPGSAVPWPVAEHEIVSARRGLTAVYASESLIYIVPAYEFTDTTGKRWSVLALAENELDTASGLTTQW
ncbi:hypothetical protein [Microbacterium sp. No. 7]|uniref:hypothetical protein n=1 Tax=Microbacterium sp. No. 7 TaxID=1714373 RepID=UPI0006D26B01|nr:hypothetical protein [Microbacterium sp. No. 7]ALJ19130.1 hypothetical protein AOA12_04115 [Microbacterium sp. No. 7]